jgi:hypothetical protein
LPVAAAVIHGAAFFMKPRTSAIFKKPSLLANSYHGIQGFSFAFGIGQSTCNPARIPAMCSFHCRVHRGHVV